MSAAYSRNDYDVAVIGGGLLGSSIAWGLGRIGQRTTVLDEGDMTRRASRANFALVWVQSKGLGMPEYTGWTVRASETWARLASEIGEQTGIDVHHQRPGGFHLALSDHEMEQRQNSIRRLHNQPGATDYKVEFLDHDEVKKRLPHIGPDVVGGTYCPLDGHVNSLKYFRAIHTGLAAFGVDYRPDQPVSAIRHEGGEFRIDTPQGEIRAGKIVLAAGNANMTLAPMVGLYAPMGPTRGQVLVTERTVPFLDFPLTTIRQTDEGTVMIGDSREEELDDRGHRLSIDAVMADRARRTFPILERLNIVRMWSGIRVMPQDGFPIYDQSETCPGAFVACCHSGVTLAPNHAFDLAPMIAAGALDEERLGAFSAKRFADKPKQASGYY
jgi:glycine/D-amino acid oxidase-like deaminating enzyme